MEDLLRVENKADEMTVQYDIAVPDSEIADIDNKLSELELQISEINKSLDKYTNDSDWIDNTVAIASGVLCGLIDSLFVGEFSFDEANEWGNEKTNNFVMKIAQSQGYEGKELPGAIKFLEDKFPIAADKATNNFGGGYYHHLRDFSHHPTPVGLFFSLLTQFTESPNTSLVLLSFKKIGVPVNPIYVALGRLFLITLAVPILILPVLASTFSLSPY